MAVKSAGAKITPESQLRSLIEKFDPKDQKLIRSDWSSWPAAQLGR
jgi:hypothetical protein